MLSSGVREAKGEERERGRGKTASRPYMDDVDGVVVRKGTGLDKREVEAEVLALMNWCQGGVSSICRRLSSRKGGQGEEEAQADHDFTTFFLLY